MILIIGLGNPGEKYKNTKHNIGKTIVKNFAQVSDFPEFKLKKNLQVKISRKQNVILAFTTCFMNESGKSVKKLLDYYKPNKKNIWIIHDEIDLNIGKIKISENRSSAGHKGIKSIINEISTKNFTRFRIGINNPDKPIIPLEKIVLKNFNKHEQKTINKIIKTTTQAIIFAIKNNIAKTMNKYNI